MTWSFIVSPFLKIQTEVNISFVKYIRETNFTKPSQPPRWKDAFLEPEQCLQRHRQTKAMLPGLLTSKNATIQIHERYGSIFLFTIFSIYGSNMVLLIYSNDWALYLCLNYFLSWVYNAWQRLILWNTRFFESIILNSYLAWIGTR